MDKTELKRRTQKFAIETIRFVEKLPAGRLSDVLGKQVLRSATSVGANYRSACKAKSTADFINKIVICEEEVDECIYWFELIIESGLSANTQFESLRKEADELTAIFTAIAKTAKTNQQLKKSNAA